MFDFHNWESGFERSEMEDTIGFDSNGDGLIDTYYMELDTNQDGSVDMIFEGHDYNQDGSVESQTIYYDYDQNGIYEEVVKGYDSDGDGLMDDIATYHDFDGDGNEDMSIREQLLDQDGDGQIDTYIVNVDSNADQVFESVEVYDLKEGPDTLGLNPVIPEGIGNLSGACADELYNFDPMKADLSRVSGNPAQAMREWEYQGNTERCALYSQKFVIEEFTQNEVHIEELAELAQKNGWYSEGSGTPLLNMDKILQHYGIQSEMSFYNEISDIQRCLESGGRIIAAIDADEIWYGENDDLFTPCDGANHAVEVIGMDYTNPDEPMVILNDSGNPNGCGEMVPLDIFLDAWEDSNRQMVSCIYGSE